MNDENLYNVLRAPRVTEKSARLAELPCRQFVFEVLSSADKALIKRAVKAMFNVEVEHVRVLNMPGKQKRFRNRQGQRSTWKKAYVTLASGHDIQLIPNP